MVAAYQWAEPACPKAQACLWAAVFPSVEPACPMVLACPSAELVFRMAQTSRSAALPYSSAEPVCLSAAVFRWAELAFQWRALVYPSDGAWPLAEFR
jgi:hypothetical protein